MKRSEPMTENHRGFRNNSLFLSPEKGAYSDFHRATLAWALGVVCGSIAGVWRLPPLRTRQPRCQPTKIERRMRESALIWINCYLVVPKPCAFSRGGTPTRMSWPNTDTAIRRPCQARGRTRVPRGSAYERDDAGGRERQDCCRDCLLDFCAVHESVHGTEPKLGSGPESAV